MYVREHDRYAYGHSDCTKLLQQVDCILASTFSLPLATSHMKNFREPLTCFTGLGQSCHRVFVTIYDVDTSTNLGESVH
jgi:hypothetical protein